MLEIPCLEFKRVFRSQCSGGNNVWSQGEGEWEGEDTRGVQGGVKNSALNMWGKDE